MLLYFCSWSGLLACEHFCKASLVCSRDIASSPARLQSPAHHHEAQGRRAEGQRRRGRVRRPPPLPTNRLAVRKTAHPLLIMLPTVSESRISESCRRGEVEDEDWRQAGQVRKPVSPTWTLEGRKLRPCAKTPTTAAVVSPVLIMLPTPTTPDSVCRPTKICQPRRRLLVKDEVHHVRRARCISVGSCQTRGAAFAFGGRTRRSCRRAAARVRTSASRAARS